MKNRALFFTITGLIAATVAGMAIALILTFLGVNTAPNLAVGIVFVVIVGLLSIVLIVEIVSVFKIDDSTIHTALIAGCLLVLYACSTDMRLFFASLGINIPETVFGIISEIAFILTTTSCCWYIIYLYNLSVKRKPIVATAVIILPVLLVAHSVISLFGYGYITHFVIVALMAIALCTFLCNAERKQKIGSTTYFIAAIFSFSVGVQTVNALSYSGIAATVPGISLAYAVLSLSMFVGVYLMFSIRTDSKALKSNEYKQKAELFETKALSGQIKPHFIFNSLEAVRTLYHKDIASGDMAVNLLSDFLRGSIGAFDSELIPFETEIDNIFCYTEFENLKRQKKIEVIFNIDYTDFSVPPFSVQPFVENALKYSGVDETENGNIIISSYKKGDCAVVEIIDNGKGFDPQKVSENSHGIRNASGRFALTLDTVPEIESAIGLGTHIKIVINQNKQKGNEK